MDYLDLYRTQQRGLARGELVYVIDQSEVDLSKDFPDLVKEDLKDKKDDLSEGICAGLVLHWIGRRHEGREFSSRLVMLTDLANKAPRGSSQVRVADASIRQAVANQLLVAVTKRENPAFLSYVEAVLLQNYGISMNHRGFRSSPLPISVDLLDREFDRSGPGLFYVGMRRPAGASEENPNAGGHALGIQYGDDGVRMFDGNNGSYAFKTRQRFFEFFADYLTETKYAVLCREATWIGKVDAPHLGRNFKSDVERLNRRLPGFDVGRPLGEPSSPVYHRMSRPTSTARMTAGWSNERTHVL